MKKLIPFLLIVFTLGCKNQDKFSSSVDPLLVGKWEITEYETTLKGIKQWESRDSLTGTPSLIVRSDGAFLSGDGTGMCCGPYGRISVNGKTVFFKAKSPVPRNEICTLVSCAECGDHDFKAGQDELVWTKCGNQTRYRRLP